MRAIISEACGWVWYPTRKLVGRRKRVGDPKHNGEVLRAWSLFTLRLDLTVAASLLIVSWVGEARSWFLAPVAWYSLSRVNEIVSAFWEDAKDRLEPQPRKSDLTPLERIRMAARSYAGLLVNFATLYCCIPIESGFQKPIESYFDALYFSGVTVATLGYGDIAPTSWFFRSLAIYEVLSGLLLVAVSIAVYVSEAQTRSGGPPASSDDDHAARR